MSPPVSECSEGARIKEREFLSGGWMRDGQNRRMEQESWTCIQQIQWRIEIIPQNGVSDAQHVDSQLV